MAYFLLTGAVFLGGCQCSREFQNYYFKPREEIRIVRQQLKTAKEELAILEKELKHLDFIEDNFILRQVLEGYKSKIERADELKEYVLPNLRNKSNAKVSSLTDFLH